MDLEAKKKSPAMCRKLFALKLCGPCVGGRHMWNKQPTRISIFKIYLGSILTKNIWKVPKTCTEINFVNFIKNWI